MKKPKSPLSIRIIYWITQVAFYLTILTGVFILAINVLFFTPFFGNDLQLHVQFPAKFSILEQGTLDWGNRHVDVELVEATSKIHFINTPMYIARWFGTAMLFAYGFMLFLVIMFRKFIFNIRKNMFFETENIEYLRYISYGLFGFWIFALVYGRILGNYLANSLHFEQVVMLQDYNNFIGILMLALFLWVLSHIFTVGARLKEEQDLTI
jgi:hypothetical protein